MPIAPRYTWAEDERHLRLRVESVRVREPGQVLAAGRLVKVNAPPYLLLLDLAGELADAVGDVVGGGGDVDGVDGGGGGAANTAVQEGGTLTLTLRKVCVMVGGAL